MFAVVEAKIYFRALAFYLDHVCPATLTVTCQSLRIFISMLCMFEELENLEDIRRNKDRVGDIVVSFEVIVNAHACYANM